MEAKDTVIPVERHSEGVVCPLCGEEFGIEDKVLLEREQQAELSFKAGREAEVKDSAERCAKYLKDAEQQGILKVVKDMKDILTAVVVNKRVDLFEKMLYKWQSHLTGEQIKELGL